MASSTLDKQAQKCVQEFVERADGNFRKAEDLWHEELKWIPHGWQYQRYVHAVCEAFRDMRPKASGKP